SASEGVARVAFRDLDAADYAGMFVSGGRTPEYIRYDADLLRVTREISEAGKPIACLCHGIEILSADGLRRWEEGDQRPQVRHGCGAGRGDVHRRALGGRRVAGHRAGLRGQHRGPAGVHPAPAVRRGDASPVGNMTIAVVP
ncbi:MAG: DJ-1/PfpI family protein, partial [Planctomycetota bacterium]|nr:DJ-1/PfpI family protein [Planctomycetota bacterium]